MLEQQRLRGWCPESQPYWQSKSCWYHGLRDIGRYPPNLRARAASASAAAAAAAAAATAATAASSGSGAGSGAAPAAPNLNCLPAPAALGGAPPPLNENVGAPPSEEGAAVAGALKENASFSPASGAVKLNPLLLGLGPG